MNPPTLDALPLFVDAAAEAVPFETLANWRLRSGEGLGLPCAEIARRAGLNPSTLYQALSGADGRKVSATQARRIVLAFPEEAPALAGYFLPAGWALHRCAGAVDTPADLRAWFLGHSEELGRLAGWARLASADGRLDACERAEGALLLDALRARTDALDAALRGALTP